MISGTPMQHQSPIGPPGVANPAMYPQLPRSSPTTATAIASATVTIQNVSNAVPPFVARGAGASTHFQNQYPVTATNDYPASSQRPTSKHHANMQYQMHQQNYNSEVYNSEHQQHMINNHQNIMMASRPNEITRTSRGHMRQNYHQQQYNQHYYNYNKNHHNSDASYHTNMNTQGNYNHSYGYNNHYGYHHGMYSSENSDNLIGNHMNQQETSNYYPNENIQHPIHKNQNHVEYPNKNNHEYYGESNMYNHMTQAEGYVPSEGFQQNVPNTATAIAAATAAVMTPPTSVQTESGDNYGNFHQFYNTDTPQTQAPAASGDNSNSSADFNFLSNLANDFAPEYYQLS